LTVDRVSLRCPLFGHTLVHQWVELSTRYTTTDVVLEIGSMSASGE